MIKHATLPGHLFVEIDILLEILVFVNLYTGLALEGLRSWTPFQQFDPQVLGLHVSKEVQNTVF